VVDREGRRANVQRQRERETEAKPPPDGKGDGTQRNRAGGACVLGTTTGSVARHPTWLVASQGSAAGPDRSGARANK
jgi:hypothetical protein